MPLSAQDALKQARANIEAARKARGSNHAVNKHYEAAKNALAKVDVTNTDPTALKEMIATFQDLAEVLDHSGARLQGKATKCRQRADILRQELGGRIRINAPAAASISASATTPVNTTSTTRQPALPSPPVAISVSAARVIPASPSFFSNDVNPVSHACRLPGPDEPLQTTRQLAYCLALLQTSVQEDDLSLDALEWRRSTLKNSYEKDRLETLSIQIIETFAKDTMKDVTAVVEVAQLAPVLNNYHSRFLLKTFIDTIDHSGILQLHSVEGLAKAIQGAAPGSIDSNDLISILRCLHRRLRSVHKRVRPTSVSHQYHLLLAVSRVLDAMVDANIGD
ncbi:hypothetical protein BGZ83_001007, partial [Gryganskiella cystojenkinii]